MRRRVRQSVSALLALATLVACTPAPPPSLDVVDEEISGPGTLGLSLAGQTPSGIVVYFHGMDQDAEIVRSDAKHQHVTEQLLRAGYAVVSADAEGNAFGNPSSQRAYRDLITAARSKYGVQRVVLLAESMGGLPALMLLGAPELRVDAMAAFTPVMGMPVGARSIDFVAAAWNGGVPQSADPMGWPPEVFRNKSFRLYAADGDGVIPPGATATDFAARYSVDADVQLETCHGGHVADTCFDADGVVKWFGSAG